MATPFRLKRSAVPGKRPSLSDVQLGELAFNTYDGYLWAERDTGGVGIGTTIALLTPWTENFGAASIYYENTVGIGTTNPTSKFTVQGDVLISGFSTVRSNLAVSGVTTTRHLNVIGFTTVVNQSITGVATIGGNLSVSGVSTFAGITTVTGTTLFSRQLNVAGISTFNEIRVGFTSLTAHFSGDYRNTIGIASELYIYHVSENTERYSQIHTDTYDLYLGIRTEGGSSAYYNRLIGIHSGFVGAPDPYDKPRVSLGHGNDPYKLETTGFGVTVSGTTFTNHLIVSGVSTLGTGVTITSGGNINAVSGVVTAAQFTTGVGAGITITTNTIFAPQLLIIDPSPAGVGTTSGVVQIKGDLYVDGTQFVVNSTSIELGDFNIGIATTVGTNALLDGAGLGIGSVNIRKNLTYANGSDSLKSSENFDLASGKVYKINGTEVLSATQLTVANINAVGVSTLGTLAVAGVTTTQHLNVTGFTTTSNQSITGVATIGTLAVTGVTTSRHLNIAGVSTLGLATATQMFVAGIATANSFRPTSGYYQSPNGTNAFYVYDGTGNVAFQGTIGASQINNASGNKVIGFAGTNITFENNANIAGITTTQHLNVTGFTTTVNQSITGVVTAGTLAVSGVTTTQHLNVTGFTTVVNQSITGVATVGTLAVSGVTTTRHLNVIGFTTVVNQSITGVATVGSNLAVAGVTTTQHFNVVGFTTVVNQSITGVLTVSNGIQGIGIQSGGSIITTGIITSINFVGAGNSFSYNAGTKTVDINIGGSQWTFVDSGSPSTSSIYRVNGNVGLGTTNPTSKLHVVGDTLVIGVSTILSNSSTEAFRITQLGSGNALVVEDETNPDSTPFVVSASGSVGIGTTNPNQIFEIYSGGPAVRLTDSDDNSYSRLRYNRTSSLASLILEADALNQNPNVTDISFRVGGVNSTDEKASISSSKFIVGLGGTVLTANLSGSVGIGTTNPRSKLEVNGVVGFTTFDYFGEITAKILIGDSETGKSLPTNVGNGNILIGVGAGTSLTSHDYNTFIGHRAGNISRSNNNTFIGYYAGYFNTTGSSNVFVGGQAGQSNDTGNLNTYLGQGAGQQGYSAAGNVALGLAAGYDNLTGSNNIFLGLYSGESTGASNKIIIGSGDLFGNKFDSPDITKNTQLAIGVRTDSNQSRYWIVGNENFNIGIGTTNPTSKLHVIGNTLVSGVSTILSNSSTEAFRITQLGTGNALIVEDSTNPDATPFVISGAGNVGIATTNPRTTLQVGSATSNTTMFVVNSLGDVGIGTTNPEHYDSFGVLTLDGYAEVGSATTFGGGNIVLKSNGQKFFDLYSLTGSTAGFSSETILALSRPFEITQGGQYSGAASTNYATVVLTSTYVGIGTTLPRERVDILGNAKVSGVTSTQHLNVTGFTTTVNQSITGVATIGTLAVSGVTTTRHLNVIGFTTVVNQSITGVATVGSNLAVAGVTTTRHLSVSGISSLQSTSLVGGGTSTGTATQTLQVTGGAYVSGSVGIGTTNPTNVLDVRGSTYIDTRLGIGRSGTAYPLTVNGPIQSYPSPAYDSSYPGFSGLEVYNGSLGGWFVGVETSGNDDLRIRTSNSTGTPNISATPVVQINRTSLNVGIGTTNPTSKLHVLGDVLITGVTNTQHLNVTGFTTTSNQSITGVATIGTLAVSGVTTTRHLNVIGFTTVVNQSVTGVITAGTLAVSGVTTTQHLNVTGIATLNRVAVTTEFNVYAPLATFYNNVNINGTLSIGGTTILLNAEQLQIKDKDIVLGVTTNALGNDVSKDSTANHGGIAIASTEGTPLIDISVIGIDTIPSTYKQIMWIAKDTLGAGTTDAWHFNYGVGIGSTQIPNGVRLAVGRVQVTDNTVSAENLSLTGVATVASNLIVAGVTSTRHLSVTGFTTIVNESVTGVSTIGTLVVSGVATTRHLNVIGFTTTSNQSITGVATVGSNFAVAGVTTTQHLNVIGFTTVVNQSITGVATIGTLAVSGVTTTQHLNVTGFTTVVNQSITGVATVGSNFAVAGVTTTQHLNVIGFTTVVNQSITGVATIGTLAVSGVTTTRHLSVSGISSLQSTTLIGGGTSTGTASQLLQVAGGAYINGNIGLGTTNPISNIHINSATARSIVFTGDSGGSFFVMGNKDSGGSTGPNVIQSGNRNLLFGVGDSFTSSTGGTFTEYMRLNSNANFLIGSISDTATASQKLQVTGGAYVSGNLGVGATNPGATLQVFGATGTAQTGASLAIIGRTPGFNNSTNSVYGAVNIGDWNTLGQKTIISLSSRQTSGAGNLYTDNGGEITALRFNGTGTDGATGMVAAEIAARTENTTYGNAITDQASLVFKLSGSGGTRDTAVERMRLTGAGSLGIGTTNPQERVDILGNARVSGVTSTQHLNVTGIATIANLVVSGIITAVSVASTYAIQGSVVSSSSTTAQIGIHSALPSTTYRSVEYMIQAAQPTNFHTTKILVVHNGTTAYLTEYGTIYNSSVLADYDVDISGGNIRLLSTPASAGITTYTISFIATRV